MGTSEGNETAGERQRADFEETRERLIRDFDISSSFVRVPALAKILGVTPSTIYAAMREKRFFLPHRVVCTSPAVKLDDLAEWFCSAETETPAAAATEPRKPTGRGAATQREWEEARRSDPPRMDTEKDLVAKVLARMAREDAEKAAK